MASGSVHGLNILVVEDDPMNALLCEEQLAICGAKTVVVCHNAVTALSLLQDARFDVAVVDFQLMGENSLTILDRLEELNIPRVLVSGCIPERLPGRFTQALLKPYTCVDLVRAIEVSLEKRLTVEPTFKATAFLGGGSYSRPALAFAANEDMQEVAE